MKNRHFNLMKNKYQWVDYNYDTYALIGSTKFKSRFLDLARDLEMDKGKTVLHTHIFSHADGYEINSWQLDNAKNNGHNRIDKADCVVVISPDLNIGENTLEELEYAYEKESVEIEIAPIRIGVHNGVFHADDVLCCAMILKYLEDKFVKSKLYTFVDSFNVEIVRTRDSDILDTCDWVVDVGFEDVVDEKNMRFCFDHHQKDSKYYPNGIKMAACGKLATHLYEYDQSNPDLLKYLRESLLYAIEAQDNGQNIADFGKYPNPISFVRLLNNNWNEDDPTLFDQAVSMTYEIYDRIIDKYYAEKEAADAMYEYIANHKNDNDGILVMDKYVSWQEEIIKYNNDVLNSVDKMIYVVIFPTLDGYTAQVVPKELNSYDSYVSFPKTWRGVKEGLLDKISGIDGGKFCHAAGFLSSWKTLNGAKEAARKAIEASIKK